MRKYLQIKLGMEISEVNNILGEEIKLKIKEDGYSYFNKTYGIYLYFEHKDKKLHAIGYNELFNLSIDGFNINMHEKELRKIKGEPNYTKSIPENKVEYLIYEKSSVCYEIDTTNGKIKAITISKENL